MKDYLCPICKQSLDVEQGDGMRPDNGVMVFCPHRNCPAQEVKGHGMTIDAAFEIVLQKFPVDKNPEPAII